MKNLIVGVGGAGNNIVSYLQEKEINNCDYLLIHTDKNLSTPKKLPVEGQFLSKMFKFINKSIKPSAHEIAANRRSRSAKLSVLERIQ